ncbi:lipoprotein-releasing system permease protein [Flavobacterium arsenatis]|uniref:Lipoprotein-releasing system permease protein n=1 Tax=Flavobacterium arsenatis TaxID=1484332 RepID=A0ABU1TU89_9FLAO|nr:FtsX-like permease family protein [Flavobacterium arsenatis]MDR6969442.1 lipoprotein-releasing system permease protein [Flavobacterium arsenatis]
MNFSLYIAKRYLRSASKNNAINIINWIATIGIIVGSMAMFVIMSVFSGLVDFSLSFTNSVDPDLKVLPLTGKSFLISPEQESQIKGLKDVAFYSKVAEEQLLFMFNDKQQIANLKGVDSIFTKVSTIEKGSFAGEWVEPGTVQVVVGGIIAQKLSMGLMDFNNPFEVFVPIAGKGDINRLEDAFRKEVLVPIGVYSVNEEIDAKYVFCDLPLIQELLNFQKNQITGLELKLKPEVNEANVVAELQKILGNNVIVKNRAQLNDSLYKMLNTENIAVYLIFTLVIIVVLFNLIGALIMMILEKKGNLKTLYNLGTEIKDLRKIFLLQGTLLCVVGGLIGVVLGLIIVFLQQQFQLIMITDSLAYPVKITIMNIFVVLGTVIVLGFVASLIASSRVSKKLME